MAEILVGPVVDLLLSVVSENINLIIGFEDELGQLKGEVEMIRAVLRDAERRSPEEEAVRLWLNNLHDHAYRAADLLDEFTYDAIRRRVEVSQPSSSKRSFMSKIKIAKKPQEIWKPSIFSKRKMAKKIKEIFASLEIINKQASNYGLQRGGNHAPSPHAPENRETSSLIDMSEEIVGREDDTSKIMEMLTSESNLKTVVVLPIVGMGGLGKTTLAKQIYNSEWAKNHFEKRIWISVSDDFNVKRLLKGILESVVEKRCEVDTMDAILKELQREMGEQKYLLVLDDVWNENRNKWDEFKSCLQSVNTSEGNNIVVTTRSAQVGRLVGTFDQPYYLKGLSNDKCWSIFSARAFANGGVLLNNDFEAIGKQIVTKCAGLPLAAKVAGSMMCSKQEKHEWLSIANSRLWDSNGDEDGVLPILKLSFDNLPSPSLKHCFAYCSTFTKDFDIDKEDLVHLWMALGYLQPNEENNVKMEDIGTMYFNMLLQSSLFQDIKTDIYGNVVGCKMHDMVHDLARYIAKREVFTVEANMRLAIDKIHHVRHLALYNGGVNFDTIQQGADKLRTLVMPHINNNICLGNFKCLRVLKLDGFDDKNALISISELIHLRYLDMSKILINVLPSSITKLFHLKTLRLGIVKCLPKNFTNLISLRHLYFHVFEMPLKIGNLTCLQTLPTFIVSEEKGRQIEELGSLEDLGGKLQIRSLEKVRSKEDAESANLPRKTKIDKLILVWQLERVGGINIDEDIIEGLQPHPNLKALEIRGFEGDNFPVWLMNMAVGVGGSQLLLENLVELKLKHCNRVEGIPIIGHLPLLRHVHLERLDRIRCIGESFYGYNEMAGSVSSSRKLCGGENCRPMLLFPALKELVLEDMWNLEEWMGATASPEEVVVFPCLEKLFVNKCRKLRTAPSHFPRLKELEIQCVDSSFPVENICSDLTTLTHLKIHNVPELIALPDGLLHNNKHHFRNLSIFNCKNLKSIPSLEGLTSLTTLHVATCEMLECVPKGLQSCTSLFWLELCGQPEWDTLPEEIQYLHALRYMCLNNFGAEAFPDWLGNLEELEELRLQCMHKLKYLPSKEAMVRLTNLRRLWINGCPLLKSRCKEGDCPEWSKISTVANIKIAD